MLWCGGFAFPLLFAGSFELFQIWNHLGGAWVFVAGYAVGYCLCGAAIVMSGLNGARLALATIGTTLGLILQFVVIGLCLLTLTGLDGIQ